MRYTDIRIGTSTVSHDSLPMPMDITAAETYLRHYDTVLGLDPRFVQDPIRPVPTVHQDDAYASL